jgi:hypothetical protein
MSEFKREPRYIVFKISDIENYLTKDDKAKLLFIGDTIACARKFQGRPPFNAAVVEQDWPRTTSHHTGDCPEALFAQAPEIADEAMTELLREHAKCADEHGVMWGLCDADGDDVATLAEADAPLVEAVKWLQKRKLCELVESPHGATVLLFSAMGGATR